MATPLDTPVHLKERESLRLQDGSGVEVRCLLGNLWITEEGEREDRILSRAQSFSARPAGSVATSPRSAVPLCSSCSRAPPLCAKSVAACGVSAMARAQRDFPCALCLPAGECLTLRPVTPDDSEVLQAYVRGLSPESRYNRFFGALQELPPAELERVTHLDRRYDLALVAETDVGAVSIVIGEARHAFTPDRLECEFAISVADDWRGQGDGYAAHGRNGVSGQKPRRAAPYGRNYCVSTSP